jgi:hypothetical protein
LKLDVSPITPAIAFILGWNGGRMTASANRLLIEALSKTLECLRYYQKSEGQKQSFRELEDALRRAIVELYIDREREAVPPERSAKSL